MPRQTSHTSIYQSLVKPCLDRLFALLIFVFLSPFLAVVGLMLALHFKKSPFFRQQRIGLNEIPFDILKFRTFDVEDDHSSVSSFAAFLRKTSVDEMPQLINIMLGQMSFVGPRPLFTEYLQHYNAEQSSRHAVRPGVTGLAQISMGNSEDWNCRLAYDVEYVDKASLKLDLKILFLTAIEIFFWRKKSSKDVSIQRFDDFARRNAQLEEKEHSMEEINTSKSS
ncbi:MAG: sugar transferase [Bacteroidota bacterium]